MPFATDCNYRKIDKQRRPSVSGFTLLEIIVTIGIVSALAIVAFAAIWGTTRTFKLDAASTKVISDIRYAQHLARTHNGWYGIRFQANPANRYSVYRTNGITDTNVQDPSNPSSELVVNVAAEYRGVVIGSVNIAGGDKVEFNPVGTPYSDALGSPLASTGTVTLSSDGSGVVIRVIKNTGRAEFQ